MENVTFIEVADGQGAVAEHAVIAHADGSFSSMLKSTYDAQQAEQSTPMVAAE